MNPNKILKIIENREWTRLKAIAENELSLKQIKLGEWLK